MSDVRGVLVDHARMLRRWNRGVVLYAPSFTTLLSRYEMQTRLRQGRLFYFYVAKYPLSTKVSVIDRDAKRVTIEKCYLADWELEIPVPPCVYCERSARFWRWTIQPGLSHLTVVLYPLCQHHETKRTKLLELLEIEV